jgi:AraC-like DNA-binding protein
MLQCNRFDSVIAANPAGPKNGNRVNFSALRHCELEQYKADTYSIKYIQQGTEHYFLKGRRFSVSAGNFLLVNNRQPIDVYIHSRKKVIAFCIHLEEGLLQEMYAQLLFGERRLLDQPFEKPDVPPFEEILYSDKENSLGIYLQQMAGNFDSSTETIRVEPNSLYYHISQHLLQVQNSFSKSARQLGAIRNSTKNELVRRLEVAKEMLDELDADGLTIDAVAQQCALSGSHLFRSFKKLYGVSPYQYLLQQKIKQAANLLATKDVTVTEVALRCGFSDLPSFSKAFKKINGQSPTAFITDDRLKQAGLF